MCFHFANYYYCFLSLVLGTKQVSLAYSFIFGVATVSDSLQFIRIVTSPHTNLSNLPVSLLTNSICF